MSIRILTPADTEKLEAFLQPRLESSMFLLGNMRTSGLVDHGRHLEGTYAAAFEEDEICGVVAHYWNGMLMLQAPLNLLANLQQTAVAASNRALQGLAGPQEQVVFLKQKLQIEPSAIRMEEPENLYSLRLSELVVPEPLQRGAWRGRRARAADEELLVKWRVGYLTALMGESDTPELWLRLRASIARYRAAGQIWVLEDGQQPVSMTGYNTAIREAVQVGGVWTPSELRSRGYGRAVVAASLLDARREGVEKAILFTGVDNVAAQKAYTALGFLHIGDYCLLHLHNPRASS